MSLKNYSAILLVVFLLLFSNSVFAQDPSSETIFTEMWNAIQGLDEKVSQMINDIQALYIGTNALANDLILFKNDVNNEIFNLHLMDDTLFNSLNATNVTVQENTDSINVHSQQINDLNQADQGLQNQISGISNIQRDKLYEKSDTGALEINLYCDSPNHILINSYCAGGFLGDLSQTAGILFDDFSDGDYSVNPTWTIGSGSWTAISHALVGSNYLGGSIYTNVDMAADRDYRIDFTIMQNTPNVVGIFKWFTNGGSHSSDGYDLAFHDNGNIYLYRVINGIQMQLINAGPYQINVPYDVTILHQQNGLIEVYVNGALMGSTLDTTYDSGSKISFSTGNGIGVFTLDNVSISNSIITTGTGGFLNVNDYNSPMGIKCNYGREARIICYNPD